VATAAGHDFFLRYDSNGRQIWSFQMQPSSYRDDKTFAEAYRVAAGAGGVYFAGSSVEDAMIGEVSSLSSLIFFGLNPPLSFGVVGLLAGIGVASVFLMRRRWKRKYRPLSANMLRFKEVGKGHRSSHVESLRDEAGGPFCPGTYSERAQQSILASRVLKKL